MIQKSRAVTANLILSQIEMANLLLDLGEVRDEAARERSLAKAKKAYERVATLLNGTAAYDQTPALTQALNHLRTRLLGSGAL